MELGYIENEGKYKQLYQFSNDITIMFSIIGKNDIRSRDGSL